MTTSKKSTRPKRPATSWRKNARPQPLFLGVEHVGIYPNHNVSGQAIVEWYRDNFGFEIKEGKTNFFIGNIGQGRIEVMKHPLTDKCHLAIRVSDFEQAVAALKARGIALEEPLPTPPGMKAVFLKDPDPAGNLVHLLWIEE